MSDVTWFTDCHPDYTRIHPSIRHKWTEREWGFDQRSRGGPYTYEWLPIEHCERCGLIRLSTTAEHKDAG